MKQGEELMNTVQSGASFSGNPLETVQTVAGKGVETVVSLQTVWLDFVEQQNTQMVKILKQNLNIDESSPVNAVTDLSKQ